MNAKPGRLPRRSPIVEATVEDGESAATVATIAVAAVSNVPVTALPPLYERVEPGVLGELFSDQAAAGAVAFPYDGYLVVVTATERVQVYDDASTC